MPTKKYVIQWTISDAQAKAVHRDAMARAKALESAHLSALKAMERAVVAGAGKGGNAVAAHVNGHKAMANGAAAAAKTGADASIGHARRASAEKARLLTQEEAAAKSHEQTIRAINKRMVDDAVLAERARARAVTAAGVGGMHAVSKTVRAGVDDYSGVQYKTINNKLRGVYHPGDAESDRINAHARQIDAAIAAGSLSKSTVLHRGASLRSYGLTEVPKPGDVIKDKAFGSTSTRREIAEGFSKGVMWEIHARKGTKAADVSHLTGGGEAEVLLARNQAMKVRSTHVDEQGRQVIVADAMRSHQEQRDRDAMAQTLRLRRDVEATESQRIRAAQAEMRRGGGGRTVAAAVGGMGAEGEKKIDVGYYKVVADQVKAAQKKEAEIDSLTSRYVAKDYQRRVAAEAKKEKIDDFAKSRTAKAITDLETLESSYLARDYQARVKYEERKEKAEAGPAGKRAQFRRQDLNEEQVHINALNSITDVRNKRRIEGAAKVMGEQRLSFAEAIHSAIGLDSAMTKAGIALAGVAAAKAGILGVAGAILEARKNAEGFGKTTVDFMIALRPLASELGVKPDFAFAQKVARFGTETAMPKADAASFLESFAGRAQITKGVQISDAEYEKFTTSAGKMTTARGIPTDTAGDLFASVLKIENFKRKGQGSKEAMARAGGLFDILDAGSGKVKELAPQAQQLMAALASENELEGVFRNAGEVGVMTSLMAENVPGEAAVFARSGIKALSQFGDKARQPFYKRAGIVAGMPGLERFQRANTVFEQEVGKGRPLESVLEGFGLAGDVREKTALMTSYKARNTVLAPQLERMKSFEAPGAADRVQRQVDDRFKDQDILMTKARAENEAADLQKQALNANLYRERAARQLKDEGYYTNPLKMLSMTPGYVVSLGQRSGLDTAIEGRAIGMAQKDAGVAPGVSLGQAAWGDTNRTINDLIKIMERNTAAAEKQNVLLDKQQQQKAAPQTTPAALAIAGPRNGPGRG